ncbi:MAG: sigma-54-dependent Fis family transcriptional regulator [Acidobacteria bacterium]|nr:sigma-54-dependent Fis family transcriptional regulator [Acidobacteriota bacterium]
MAKKGSILVVDDEEIMRDVLETLLSSAGYRVGLAKTGEEGLELYQQQPFDLVLLDVSMPGMGGLNTLEALLKHDPEAVVIMITAYATFDTAVTAWQVGAYNCIRKPFENNQILRVVEGGLRRRRKDEEHRELKKTLRQVSQKNEIIARSPRMLEILELVEQIAPARTTVLIQGESGTGKELIARALHFSSPRSESGQFVTVNSGNIPTELLESELFGHLRGAFTGAFTAKKGLFEVADGGSIFLDEIGNLAVETQSKLLRVIQEREFIPLGDTSPRRVDVRIIAATNVDLRQHVAEGKFREDLFYRLNVISIDLPPLRERREDILPLAKHFIHKYNEENARHLAEEIRPEILALLEAYPWPGNVRELASSIERAVVISRSNELELEYLRDEILHPERKSGTFGSETGPLSPPVDISQGISFYDEVARFEVSLIRKAMDLTSGHQSRAAKLLGLNATTLNSKIKTYNIKV